MKRPRRKPSRKQARAHAAGYEKRDLTPRAIGYAAIALLAGIGVSLAVVAGIFAALDGSPGQPQSPTLETARQTPPWPRLEINGRVDRRAVESAAEAKLQGYGWIDRSAGITRIPIARAMKILAARGWPDRGSQ